MEVVKDTDRNIYTVSQVNRKIRVLLESEFATLWLEGEISNFKHHSSGHMYFTVKDKLSQISAVFFSRQNKSLKFKLKDGMQVLIFGRISSYEPRGQYQVYVDRIEPKGVGSLQLAFEQLKEKLSKEGLFAEDHKKLIPKYPKRVGVVTSPTGAAIRDILNVIGRRFAGTPVLINPVKVQGEGAAQEVAKAIGEMNEYGEVDVLIVGRGGGSLEDLWAFNEEVVARAIYKSKIPVISAVGHEVDWTISDLVADLRAPTPSAAAELVVQNRALLEENVLGLRTRLKQAVLSFTEQKREQIQELTESYAFKQPHVLVEQAEQRLDDLFKHFGNAMDSLIVSKKHLLESAVGKLETLSPLKILSRGYSLTFKEGKRDLLRNAEKLKKGETIVTRLHQGEIVSVMEKIST